MSADPPPLIQPAGSDGPPLRRRAVVVLVLVAVLLSACTSDQQSALTAAPDLNAARHVLAGYGAAVRQHRIAAVLAALDPDDPAYRAQQRREFDNRASVPLTAWSYDVIGTIDDAAARQAAREHYRTNVLLVHVRLRYALRGVDTVATARDQYLAFVRRAGQAYLAGDDALAAGGMHSWFGPWHYGPLAVARAGDALVLGPRRDVTTLQQIAEASRRASAVVASIWRSWPGAVAVVVAPTITSFTALSGSGVRDIEASAVTDSIDPLTGRAVGQRVVLNPSEVPTLTATGLGIVLRHEITHLATAAVTTDTMPAWLVEGLAEYVGNTGSGQHVRTAAQELLAAVRAGQLPSALPGDDQFSTGGARAARAYEQAWLACRLIAALVGASGLVRFYRSVGTAVAPGSVALAAAFRSVLHMTPAAFTARWRTYLRSVIGS